MNQFSFFDAPPEIARPDVVTNVSIDVRRIVQHRVGPFREVKDGLPTGREYRYVELYNGLIVCEFTDSGERRPAPLMTAMLIEDGLRNGMFVEVASS